MSLWCLLPSMNHLPPVCWSTFGKNWHQGACNNLQLSHHIHIHTPRTLPNWTWLDIRFSYNNSFFHFPLQYVHVIYNIGAEKLFWKTSSDVRLMICRFQESSRTSWSMGKCKVTLINTSQGEQFHLLQQQPNCHQVLYGHHGDPWRHRSVWLRCWTYCVMV